MPIRVSSNGTIALRLGLPNDCMHYRPSAVSVENPSDAGDIEITDSMNGRLSSASQTVSMSAWFQAAARAAHEGAVEIQQAASIGSMWASISRTSL